MTITLGTKTDFTPVGNAPSPQTQAITVASGVDMLVCVVTIFDTSSTDGVVSGINLATPNEDFIIAGGPYYDALCDGHVSVWYLTTPSSGTSNVDVSFGGTVTDFMASVIEVNTDGAGFIIDAAGNGNAGTGGTDEPVTDDIVTSAASIIFGAMLDDQPTGGNVTLVSANSTSMYITDVGSDTVAAAYREESSGGTYNIKWADSDQDEDWVAIGVAFKEGTPPTQVVNQTFRIRSDDSQTLNADAGWAAAIGADASIAAMQRFRIRFEVEETGGVSFSSACKLQFSKNSGTWTDLAFYDETAPAAAPAVWCVLSGQYVDLDATTDVLSNSAEAFVAGDGNEDPLTVAITLSNQHTEHEFTLMIPTFYDAAGQNVGDDTFDFRMVESGGTIFNGTYDNPRITLTVPIGHIGACAPESPNRWIVADGNGNIYVALEPASTDSIFMMIKSTDGGDTWAEMDGSNRPSYSDLEGMDIAYDSVNKDINIIHQGSGVEDVVFHRFRPSDHPTDPDTWEITDEVITASVDADDQHAAIQHRSDNTIVGFYRKVVTNEGVYYKIRSSGGSWGSEVELDTEASIDFTAVTVCKGASDKIHIFYKDNTNGYIYHKSLNISDTLSARELVHNDAGIGNTPMKNVIPPVYWDDAGDEKIMFAFQDDSDAYIYTVTIINDGTPSSVTQASDNTCIDSEGGAKMPLATLAVDSNDDVYLHYADLTSEDLYRDKNSNDGGWGTDVEEIDGLSLDWLRSTSFTHNAGNGSAEVIGYVYDNGSAGFTGYIYYDEYEVPLSGVTINCQTATFAIAGQSATVLKGGVTIAPTVAGSISLSGQGVTITSPPPAQIVNCQSGDSAITGLISSVLKGAVSVECQSGSAIISGQSASILKGSVTIICQAGVLVTSGQASAILVGGIIVNGLIGNIVLSGQDTSILTGGATINCASGALSTSGLQANVTSLAGTVVYCQSGTLIFSGQVSNILTGAVLVNTNTGNISLFGNLSDIIATTIISCQTGDIALSGLFTDVNVGAINVLCQTGNLTIAGQSATITIGEVIVTCQPGILTLIGSQVDILTAIIIVCATTEMNLSGQSADISDGTPVSFRLQHFIQLSPLGR